MADKITFTITRRKLTEIIMGLVALFFAGGALASILKYLWPATAAKGESVEIKIANVDEVPTGSVRKFMFNGKASVLLHMPAGFRAFGSVCTHLGCIASWKPDDNLIFCPCHLGKVRSEHRRRSFRTAPIPSPGN